MTDDWDLLLCGFSARAFCKSHVISISDMALRTDAVLVVWFVYKAGRGQLWSPSVTWFGGRTPLVVWFVYRAGRGQLWSTTTVIALVAVAVSLPRDADRYNPVFFPSTLIAGHRLGAGLVNADDRQMYQSRTHRHVLAGGQNTDRTRTDSGRDRSCLWSQDISVEESYRPIGAGYISGGIIQADRSTI